MCVKISVLHLTPRPASPTYSDPLATPSFTPCSPGQQPTFQPNQKKSRPLCEDGDDDDGGEERPRRRGENGGGTGAIGRAVPRGGACRRFASKVLGVPEARTSKLDGKGSSSVFAPRHDLGVVERAREREAEVEASHSAEADPVLPGYHHPRGLRSEGHLFRRQAPRSPHDLHHARFHRALRTADPLGHRPVHDRHRPPPLLHLEDGPGLDRPDPHRRRWFDGSLSVLAASGPGALAAQEGPAVHSGQAQRGLRAGVLQGDRQRVQDRETKPGKVPATTVQAVGGRPQPPCQWWIHPSIHPSIDRSVNTKRGAQSVVINCCKLHFISSKTHTKVILGGPRTWPLPSWSSARNRS